MATGNDHDDQIAATTESRRCMKVDPARWGDRCYLTDHHEGECHFCAACAGDPEALGLHVCGKEPFE